MRSSIFLAVIIIAFANAASAADQNVAPVGEADRLFLAHLDCGNHVDWSRSGPSDLHYEPDWAEDCNVIEAAYQAALERQQRQDEIMERKLVHDEAGRAR